jgi:putative intracellular protease/amidase
MFSPAQLRAALLCATTLAGASPCGSTLADQVSPARTKVAILIFNGVEIIDYSGPYEVFADAGYEVFTVAVDKKPITTAAGDGETVTPKYSFADAPQADIVVVPGGDLDMKNSAAAVAWIKRENEHDQHTMSVCNGAFTLAKTGLLDGLSATTTASNIIHLRQEYPRIKVVNDRRVVDNGKILATAGLSAGIDGALRMVDVLDGRDAAQSVALEMEYNWQPDSPNLRGAMADHLIPIPDLTAVADWTDQKVKGDDMRWEATNIYKSRLSAAELLGQIQAAYAKAYAGDGPWSPGSFHIKPSGPLHAGLSFDDRDGHHWQGTVTVEPKAGADHLYLMRISTARAG